MSFFILNIALIGHINEIDADKLNGQGKISIRSLQRKQFSLLVF